MRISLPGTSENGFVFLDAAAAVLLLCLAWAAIVPVTVGIIRKTRHRFEVQRNLYEEKNTREDRSWYFQAPDEE